MNPEAALNAIARHLKILWRAESLIAEVRLRSVAERSALLIFAGLICVFGLVMLNIAAYAWLTPIWGAVWAAVAVAVADFVVAGILAMVATKRSTNPQLMLATEMRDQAVEAIESDMKIAVVGLTGMVRNPMSFSGPLVMMLIKALRTILASRKSG
jgi:hypothetical protein